MYQILIDKLDHQARGIGKIDNKVVFVPKCLPEEIVDIDIIEEKKSFCVGKLNHIIKTNSNRIKSICPCFNECGGCQLLDLSYEKTLEFKEQKIKEIIKKYLPIDIKLNPIIKSSENLYYRNKATFQCSNDMGFYKEKSNQLIPIDICYICDKKINEIYKSIKNNINVTGLNQLIIRKSKNNDESMVIFKTDSNLDQKKLISVLDNMVDSIYINDKLIYGKEKIKESISNCIFNISPTAFFQVNTLQAEKLYNKAIEYADISKEDLVLDLYCGTGTIGVLASKYAKKVIGIELNKKAIEDANENKKINDIKNIEFYAGDVGNILNKYNYKPDVIIVDPPRAGLNSLALHQILKIKSKKLVYISCDVMTLMRDLKILIEYYNILELTPVDMFPMTSHIECIVKLERK